MLIKPRLPVEVALFLHKSYKIVEDKRKRESKNKCRVFKTKKNRILKEYS